MRPFYLLLALLLVANYSFGQQTQQEKKEGSPKQVIIIKKTIDANGNEKTERIIHEGDELHEMHLDSKNDHVILKEIGVGNEQTIQVTVDTENDDVTLHKNVNVEVEEINGEKHVKVRVQPLDGEEKVIEWQGEGEIPLEIREKLEADGIFLHETGKDGNGEKGAFFFNGKDMDENADWQTIDKAGPFLGVLSAQESKVTVVVDENGKENRTESNSSDVDGVLVGEVLEGSAAAEAGLLEGDILKAIDGKPLHDFSDLVDFMQSAEIGQQININYQRGEQQVQTTATLQERKGGLGNMMIEKTIDQDLDGNAKVFIYKTDGEDGTKIRTHHKVVVITRGDRKKEEGEDALEMPAEALPEADLQRDLQLRDYRLFPNPTNGNLRLRFAAEAVPTVVRITDLSGKRLYRELLNQFDGQYDQNIDLSDLPAGLLLLTIEQADKVYTEQIVLK